MEASPFAQCSVFLEDQRRERWEQLDKTVDGLRSRYGYHSIRRAVMYGDKLLGSINPRDDHTVHPVGFFGG